MILDPILDIFRGKALTIPPLDGALRPNTALDDASVFASLPEPDNLVVVQGHLMASSGNSVFKLGLSPSPELVQFFDAPISAMAVAPSGELAVALETGRLFVGSKEIALPRAVTCITALAFLPDGMLYMTHGSSACAPSEWAKDLMQKGASGSLWGREPSGGAFREIASGLTFPNGLHIEDGSIVVSESWRHRLIRFDRRSGRELAVALDHIPGYPARMSAASDGGVWLSIFAPRNRLIEFVLQEEHYRQDMLTELPPQYWISPALSSNRGFLEPLQCGAIKSMGVHKPWSPSRSYGLVVKLDTGLQPVSSLHSRANGTRHGTCSAVEHDGRLFVAAKGGDVVLTVDAAEAA